MKRLAIFVEGQTEQILVQRLLQEMAGAKKIDFEVRKRSNLTRLTGNAAEAALATGPKYFVLIYDCEGDEQVKSMALDQRDSLIKAGYELVLGLRDLYPATLTDLPKIKMHLQTGVPTKQIRIRIMLAVAEIEAWFLQEYSHFQRIDPKLTPAAVRTIAGIDFSTTSAETVLAPAACLHAIYASVGKAYAKKRKSVQRTVDVLDIALLYCVAIALLPHFAEFCQEVEQFLT